MTDKLLEAIKLGIKAKELQSWRDKQKREEPENGTPLDVTVGDTIYFWCPETDKWCEYPVVAKSNGHHYALTGGDGTGSVLSLLCCTAEYCSKTPEDAVLVGRKEILGSQRFAKELLQELETPLAILKQLEAANQSLRR